MRLGIFGGTFDPPHIGHLVLASEAYHQLALDSLVWVLTPHPPHKPNQKITSLQYRIKMVRSIVENEPIFELSSVEIDRSPPHFAVDTVKILGNKYPNAQLIYLLGGDSLRDLPLWRQAQKFICLVDALGVMRRPHIKIDLVALERQLPGLREKLRFFEAPLLQISSTDIRRRVHDSHPYRYLLSPPVYEIIQKYNLYLSTV